ncbi:MAG: DUF429 domain-containing protein [Pseudomonadota bacterium]
MTYVAGVDGCRAGWVVALHPAHRPDQCRILHVPQFADVLAIPEAPRAIAVDIPIGLPDQTGRGGRDADVGARAVLGGRQSAVFAVPSRAAVMCEEYRAACDLALQTSDPPRKVSKQAFNIFPKIREVDRVMTPELQDRVREVHPELAFWALNGQQPLATPKKIKSKPNPDGLAQRRSLLAAAGYDPDFLTVKHLPARIAGPDDVLDATVNAWTATRLLAGHAIRFPSEPQRDARGLRIEIWG